MQDLPKFNTRYGVWEVFALMLVIRKIIRSSSECESTRGLVKCCILLFLEKEKIDEKTSGMWDFGEKGAGTRDQDPALSI